MAAHLDQTSRPRRIAVVTPRFPPDVGGLENYANQMTEALAERGHSVIVITSHPQKSDSVEQRGPVTVYRLATTITLSNTPINPVWYWRLRRLFRRHRIELVCTHSPVPYLADLATLAAGRRPVIATYHAGTMVKGVGGPVDLLLKTYERWVLPRVLARAERRIAVSPIALTAKSKQHSIITPGVNLEIFGPGDADSSSAGSGARREPVVLFAGRVETASRWKGLHVLVEAMPQLVALVPGARLEIVGDGDLVPELKAQAASLGVGDSILWRGQQTATQLAQTMRRVQVTCLPSITEAESFGMTLIEAMASACPVVGARTGGIRYVIRDGVDGLLVPPNDPRALAEALARILNDPQLADRLGAAGQMAAEHTWDWRIQTQRMISEIESVG